MNKQRADELAEDWLYENTGDYKPRYIDSLSTLLLSVAEEQRELDAKVCESLTNKLPQCGVAALAIRAGGKDG